LRRVLCAVALFLAFVFSAPHGARAGDSVTHHVVHLANGAALAYTATAGTLTLRNEHNEPTADVFYVAYTTGDRKRPVTFLYNGGPGSASLWLHIGAFGPRRIVTTQTRAIPPAAGRLVDNPSTLLDTSDLVFIDPVGTGYSTVTGKGTNKDFWGVDEDISAFSQFIRRWIAANDRATSPKFLLGESYGTFRSGGLVDRLQNDGMAFNGVILLSSLLDYADDFGNPGDDNIPDAFAIPSEAAVAWYHKKVPNPPADLTSFLDAARQFTSDEYLPAVLRAGPLDAPAQARLAQRLHAFIGLDPDYLLRANLRVSTARFEGELLRSEGKIVGRYDGRFAGNAMDRNAGEPEFDPSYEAVAPAFITTFTAYAKSELGWRTDRMYRALPGDVVNNWNFRRRGFFGRVLAPTVIPDLREAMHLNPNLRVFAANGLFDLATPFYTTEYELANVGLDPAVRARITLAYYQSGHMIYLSDDALRALRADLGRFYARAVTPYRAPGLAPAAPESSAGEAPRRRARTHTGLALGL
jgi:carboxypeptidase C (cathepsin A)